MLRFNHMLRSRGFSLIEVLIALVILSVGLLGIAAMVSVSLKSKDSSYYHTQALALSAAILDRMRANHDTAVAHGYDTPNYGNVPAGAPGGDNCSTSTDNCTPAQIAAVDVADWQTVIANTLPPFPSSVAAAGSIGTVQVGEMTQVSILIRWNDQRANQAVAGSTSSAAAAAATAVLTITSGL